MLTKKVFIIVGVAIPLVVYVVTTFIYAHGGYDGKNCAGLLDAVWACSEFEYYLDWLLNSFTLMALVGYIIISAVITSIAWCTYKKYNKFRHSDALTRTRC